MIKKSMIAFALFATVVASSSFAQGPLEPPGAPAPTMKTLQQIEPRTPITNLPYTIAQPGSYYLTGNLTSSTHGVVVEASGVTLDLMGFVISGDRGTSDFGIHLNSTTQSFFRGVTVVNGSVHNFGIGLVANNSQGGRFEHLTIVSNSTFGILISGGINATQIAEGNVIRQCVIRENSQFGIYLNAQSSRCDGNLVESCVISGNGVGIILSGQEGVSCEGNVIINNTITRNGFAGVYLNNAAGNRIENNHITRQTGTPPTYGVYSAFTTRNFIFSNTAYGNSSNYLVTANDIYGPIVTNTGSLATTGVTSHPKANFSR